MGDPAAEPAAAKAIAERLYTIYRRNHISADNQERVDNLLTETDLADRLSAAQSYQESYAIFMDYQMKFAGKYRWGNHVPRDLFELEHIFAFFPDAKVVVCTRNVLDFLVSYRDSWKQPRAPHKSYDKAWLRKMYHPVITSLLWEGSMRRAHVAFYRWDGQVLLNRYEELVSDPERQVRKICKFIGEAFEPAMLEVDFHNSSQNVAAHGIYSDSIGRWREMLSHSEAFVAQTICRKGMQYMGYARATARPNMLAVMWHVITAPLAFCRALAASQWQHGPLFPYLAKRFAAFTLR